MINVRRYILKSYGLFVLQCSRAHVVVCMHSCLYVHFYNAHTTSYSHISKDG